MKKFSILICSLAVAQGAFALVSPETASAGRPLSATEVREKVVGKVMTYDGGRFGEIRYDTKANGYLFANGNGSSDSATWELKEDGNFCVAFRKWSSSGCRQFFEKDGQLFYGTSKINGIK